MSKEYEASQYDEIYAAGGSENIYDLPYQHSGYYPLFKAVLRVLTAQGVRSVLEVGCGNGAFAHLMFDKARQITYQGFDFSAVAVERAKDRTGNHAVFYVGDARSRENYERQVDAIVCTEVLEHIELDLDVVEKWPRGVYCVCSVPNFDADNHVRFFVSSEEVRSRYGPLIEIDEIIKVKKPVLSDISMRGYLRALRWHRYQPKKLLEILGCSSFAEVGGWHVFSGRRK